MATFTIDVRLEAGQFRFDQAALDRMKRDPQGPIVQDLRKRAQRVSSAMNVPRGEGLTAGALQRSKRVEEDLGGAEPSVSVVVGREGQTDYLGWVLDGTRPHEIVPVRAKALRFIPRGGGPVFSARVRHPGTQPNDFMNRALPAAIRD